MLPIRSIKGKVEFISEDHAGQPIPTMLDLKLGDRWLKTNLGATVDVDHLAAKRRQNIAVGRVPGPSQSDSIARIESRQECQLEAPR